jgi:hypothetical protein
MVTQFAQHFFSASTPNPLNGLEDCRGMVDKGYFSDLVALYYPSSRIKEMKDRKEIQTFRLTQPIEMVEKMMNSENYGVVGEITVKSGLTSPPAVLSTQPVNLVVCVMYGKIYKVKKGSP